LAPTSQYFDQAARAVKFQKASRLKARTRPPFKRRFTRACMRARDLQVFVYFLITLAQRKLAQVPSDGCSKFYVSGSKVMILKTFSPNKLGEKLAILTKILTKHWFSRKTPCF
jgi:hypothetical protein